MGGLPERVRVRLSRRIAGLLRHYGPRYGLVVDREGWARIEDVVEALHRIPGYEWVGVDDILEVARLDDKGRYEVRGGMIRARYGHSMPGVRPAYERGGPPTGKLYHGTPLANLESILSRGLLPGRRHYVHLTTTPRLAVETGRRHGRPVAVLEVDVSCLEERGIPVYRATSHIYLAPRVPPECLRLASIEG